MTSQVKSNYKELGISLTIKRAEEKARDLHKGQYRKAKQKGEKIPYIIHPLGVAKIISEYTDDPDTIAAGLLHDTIEDCNYPLEEMGSDFNSKIVEIVKDVSEDKSLEKEQGSEESWRERKEKYLNHLRTQASKDALIVSAADKIHNLKSMLRDYEELGGELWDKLNSNSEQNLWFYGEMVKILKNKLDNGLEERLEELYKQAQQKFTTTT
jgi:(p)ppGpp synthase/HD superfamily hydrolase